eukprot:2764812-Amphidinium_carterae.1
MKNISSPVNSLKPSSGSAPAKRFLCVQDSHGPHRLDAVVRKSSLEGIYTHQKPRHCAHRSDAAVWKCSFETVAVDLEVAHGTHRLEADLWKCSFQA